MKQLTKGTVESSEMVEQTFRFWFQDQEHIRSPFPAYIQPTLKEQSINKFFQWVSKLNDAAKDEINDEIIAEKFEEIIFETAQELVKSEDEKITINFPFMPRVGDSINNSEVETTKESIVRSRSIVKEKDQSFLNVVLENQLDKSLWETRFELPL